MQKEFGGPIEVFEVLVDEKQVMLGLLAQGILVWALGGIDSPEAPLTARIIFEGL